MTVQLFRRLAFALALSLAAAPSGSSGAYAQKGEGEVRKPQGWIREVRLISEDLNRADFEVAYGEFPDEAPLLVSARVLDANGIGLGFDVKASQAKGPSGRATLSVLGRPGPASELLEVAVWTRDKSTNAVRSVKYHRDWGAMGSPLTEARTPLGAVRPGQALTVVKKAFSEGAGRVREVRLVAETANQVTLEVAYDSFPAHAEVIVQASVRDRTGRPIAWSEDVRVGGPSGKALVSLSYRGTGRLLSETAAVFIRTADKTHSDGVDVGYPREWGVDPHTWRPVDTAKTPFPGSPPPGAGRSPYYGRSFAVVVGIDDYSTPAFHGLRYAKKDASAVAGFLRGQGFEVAELYDAQATKRAIIESLQNRLAPRLQDDDRVLFFFAGHGFTERLGGNDYGYLVPYDAEETSATYLSLEELRTQSQKMSAAKHQLFILDACHGGLIATRGARLVEDLPDYLRELTRRPARQVMTAGGKDQQVLDGGPEGHSYFTHFLLEALEEGLADHNGDGYITFSELESYLKPRASNEYQTPVAAELPGHGSGEFVFVARRPGSQ